MTEDNTLPHFDKDGGDQWLCQAPNHRGNRIQSSRVESTWRPDITGHKSAGNVCPPCLRAFEVANPACDHGLRGDCLRCWLQEETARDGQTVLRFREEPPQALKEEFLNPLDYADDPAELELQRELRRTGIRNAPAPSTCPDCGAELTRSGGMVGETVLVCGVHGIVWEDAEDAVRRVF